MQSVRSGFNSHGLGPGRSGMAELKEKTEIGESRVERIREVVWWW